MTSLNDREVKTKEDFIRFLHELAKNHKDAQDEWKNKRLDGYLASMAQWVKERESNYEANNLQEPADINWGFMANMFLAAKIYE
jgi:hypothetical protein